MLARHVMHIELGLRDDAFGIVEFGDLRQMGDVAGVNHEGRLLRHRDDLVDAFFKRAECVGIGRLVEADVAVADLQEGQAGRLGRRRGTDKSQRMGHAAGNGPKYAGAGPGHAFQHSATADAVIMVVVIAHCAFLLVVGYRRGDPGRAGFIPAISAKATCKSDLGGAGPAQG